MSFIEFNIFLLKTFIKFCGIVRNDHYLNCCQIIPKIKAFSVAKRDVTIEK